MYKKYAAEMMLALKVLFIVGITALLYWVAGEVTYHAHTLFWFKIVIVLFNLLVTFRLVQRYQYEKNNPPS